MARSQQHRTNIQGNLNGSRNSGQNLPATDGHEPEAEDSQSVVSLLDLFSTSQTNSEAGSSNKAKKDRRIYDECSNNAPYFAYHIDGKKYGVVQGCCNDWNCPRCGQQRAREEYGRIVVGARELGKTHKLYMMTLTCRGRELSVKDAEDNYLVWTNKLLSSLRLSYQRAGKKWAYAGITERQTRQHPHSHYLTTYCPNDVVLVKKGEGKLSYTSGQVDMAKHTTLQTAYLEKACVRSGLGWQYDLSELESIEGASRYVAKYLFKEAIFTTKWPKGWRRVRYSQNWPKLPDKKGDAFILLTNFDWYKLATLALVVKTNDNGASNFAKQKLSIYDVIVQ